MRPDRRARGLAERLGQRVGERRALGVPDSDAGSDAPRPRGARPERGRPRPLGLSSPPDDDPATSLVSFEPEGCTDAVTGEDYGITPGDPGAELWRTDPAYAASSPAYGPGSAFGVGVDRDTGVVNRIDLYSADIPTDGGVRIGDPGASIAAAHPGATVVPPIEVAKNAPDIDYWEGRAGTVVYIHAVTSDLGVFSVAASGNLVGVCGA